MTSQRKLVQFIDGLQTSLVLRANGNDVGLSWERVTGTPAESMWVVETLPGGRGMRVHNYRYPMVYLEGLNGAIRAVSTIKYPKPLPISLKKTPDYRHVSNPLRFCTVDNRILQIKGDAQKDRPFSMYVIANQHLDVFKSMEVKGGMSGWSVFGIIIMVLAIVGVIIGIVILYKQKIIDMEPIQQATAGSDAFDSTVFDVFTSQ